MKEKRSKSFLDLQRLRKKYITDALVDPFKIIALILPVVLASMGTNSIALFVIVGFGCIGFAFAEIVNCLAQIKGAFSKKNQRYKGWLPLKVNIIRLRLFASLVAAVALIAANIFLMFGGSLVTVIPIVQVLTSIYMFAFIASSLFLTLHRIRGFDAWNKKVGSPEAKKHRGALIFAASMEALGLVVSLLVMLKPPFVMAFLHSAIAVWMAPIVVILVFLGTLIVKGGKVLNNERAIKAARTNDPVIEQAQSTSVKRQTQKNGKIQEEEDLLSKEMSKEENEITMAEPVAQESVVEQESQESYAILRTVLAEETVASSLSSTDPDQNIIQLPVDKNEKEKTPEVPAGDTQTSDLSQSSSSKPTSGLGYSLSQSFFGQSDLMKTRKRIEEEVSGLNQSLSAAEPINLQEHSIMQAQKVS